MMPTVLGDRPELLLDIMLAGDRLTPLNIGSEVGHPKHLVQFNASKYVCVYTPSDNVVDKELELVSITNDRRHVFVTAHPSTRIHVSSSGGPPP